MEDLLGKLADQVHCARPGVLVPGAEVGLGAVASTGLRRPGMVICAREAVDRLSLVQLRAVLAHELAHLQRRDSLSRLFVLIPTGVASALQRYAIASFLLLHTSLVVAALALCLPWAVCLLDLAWRRRCEYGADRLAGQITGQPYALASALLAFDGMLHQRTRPRAAWRARRGESVLRFLNNHPPVPDRVARLLEQGDTARHNLPQWLQVEGDKARQEVG